MCMDPASSSVGTDCIESSTASIVAVGYSIGGDPKGAQPAVIAYRRACQPDGTGLSHYVLVVEAAPRDGALCKTNSR